MAKLNVSQGFEVSKLAQKYDVDFHIAGRWGDTAADEELRKGAAALADPEVARRLNLLDSQLPENIRNLIAQNPTKRDQIVEFWTRQEVVQEFNRTHNTNLAFFQARVSSGKPEIDVFVNIDYAQWQNMNKTEIEDVLRAQFNVANASDFEVDFYNNDWESWGDALGLPDPRVVPPPGAIIFKPNGEIIHPSLRVSP